MIQKRPKYAEGHDVNSHLYPRFPSKQGTIRSILPAGFGPQKLGSMTYIQ